MLYGKAGVAFASYRVATQFNPRNQPLVFIGAPAERSGSTRRTESGLTLGMGAELALSDRLTARAEYSWYNFGSHAYRVDNGLVVNARANANQVKVGLSYQLF